MPRALHEAATSRAHCMKGVALSPLTCFFVRATAQLHGISDSEFIRRVLDAAMTEYIANNLFTIPAQFQTFPEPAIRTPTPSKWAALKNTPRGTVRNLKQYQDTSQVS